MTLSTLYSIALLANEPTAVLPSWWDLAKQVPALALLVFVVINFLRHLEKIDEKHRQDIERLTEAQSKRLEDLTIEYRALAQQSIRVFERVLVKLDAPSANSRRG